MRGSSSLLTLISYLESPLFGLFIAILLTAIGSLVGMSQILFLMAWLVGSLSIYRANLFGAYNWRHFGNFAGSVFIAIGLIFLWHSLQEPHHQTIPKTTTSAPPPFHVKYGGSFVFADRKPSDLPTFVIGWEEHSNLVIIPIDLFINLKFTNLRPIPTTIEKYQLQTATTEDGPWVNLCWLPFAGDPQTHLYMTSYQGLREAVPADILDPSLLNHQLLPGQTIPGWTAWLCPSNSNSSSCPGEFFKVTIEEASGSIMNLSVDKEILSGGTDTFNELTISHKGAIDLSTTNFKIVRDRCR
jgi:hypothetical protein